MVQAKRRYASSAGLIILWLILSPVALATLSAFAILLVLYLWVSLIVNIIDDPYTDKGE